MTLLSRILFALFLLLFFAKGQGDVVIRLFSSVTGTLLPPLPWLWGGLLTLVWLGALALVRRAFPHSRRAAVVSHTLAVWLAVAVVSIPFAGLWHQFLLAAVGVALVVVFVRLKPRPVPACPAAGAKHRLLMAFWNVNLLDLVWLTSLFLYAGLGAAASDTDHYELRTAQALRSVPAEGYRVGERSLATTPRLFALRCRLMASEPAGLGEMLFEQPVPPRAGAATLIPSDRFSPEDFPADSLYSFLKTPRRTGEKALDYFQRCAHRAGMKPGPAADYYLCALLLERRLDRFVAALRCVYPDGDRAGQRLPRFYAQAVMLHQKRRTKPTWRYKDNAMAENYRNYSEMGDTLPSVRHRYNLLRRSYGNTYWWYYDFATALNAAAFSKENSSYHNF
ncbi:MAG: DUF6057 family protein [Alloprevotella sp.]